MSNEPYLAEWMSCNLKSERSNIACLLKKVLILNGYQVSHLDFFQSGNTCIVAKFCLTKKSEYFVVKGKRGSFDKEYEFYRLTEGKISSAKLLDYFAYDEYSFLIFSFLLASPLNKYSKSHLLQNNVFLDIGKNLAIIHNVECSPSSILLYSEKLKKKLSHAEAFIEKRCEMSFVEMTYIREAINYFARSKDLVLCHGDFHDKNVLYDGEKISIIDPNPKINDRYIDIAYTISAYSTTIKKSDIFRQIFIGYKLEFGEMDFDKLLPAYCIVLLIRICQFYRKKDDKKFFMMLDELKILCAYKKTGKFFIEQATTKK